jgi:7-carboxy-7-deazaguanine synthase
MTLPLRVSEVFYSLQGEGVTAGYPAHFIRLQGCTVGCVWCDTKYTWEPLAGEEVTFEQILAQLRHHPVCQRVILTGGEPLEHPAFVPLVRFLFQHEYVMEVETSGTRPMPAELTGMVQLWTVSLKLAHSSVPAARRINPSAIRGFVQQMVASPSMVAWKFVMQSELDLKEVEDLVAEYGIPPGSVLLMPEGYTNSETFRKRSEIVAEVCKQRGYRFSPRLHIAIWGAKRGV